MLLKENDTILFIGDSITDYGRGRGEDLFLGAGYPPVIAARLLQKYPEYGFRFINRGTSGDRVCDLQKRWKEDCLDFHPTVVSVLIGINDTWRRYDSNDPTPVEKFEEGYRDILTQVREQLGARIVIMEPYVLPTQKDRLAWREDLDPKIQAIRQLAAEFADAYVPLDGLFTAASFRADMTVWLPDGVHPSNAGHGLIAQAWIEAVGARRAY